MIGLTDICSFSLKKKSFDLGQLKRNNGAAPLISLKCEHTLDRSSKKNRKRTDEKDCCINKNNLILNKWDDPETAKRLKNNLLFKIIQIIK